MSKSQEQDKQDIPDQICDSSSGKIYKKGRFFGKGGFARCFEITDMTTGHSFAGKIVSKTLMSKQNQREKMTQEIKIHQSLKHKNVVGFYSFFEDHLNIYIVLELCRKRSMMELHKRRKTITEPETRFYMKQILCGVDYLHSHRIIHRDLKLGNLFLNDDLQVKIGDFGLAAQIEYDGERKKTLCGTPNYIAPEILMKKGHSFEVDIWSIGCIMYTLLIGRPPFETNSLKDTYAKIKKCEYKVSPNISVAAKNMIVIMLQQEPKSRPKIYSLLQADFMTQGYTPPYLPTSVLTTAPKFDVMDKAYRTPLQEVTNDKKIMELHAKGRAMINNEPAFNSKENFSSLKEMLGKVLKNKCLRNTKLGEELSDPSATPIYWFSKWVDYSDKYGFGYQLCDGSVGVMFNDTTKIILLPNGINVHYINRDGEEEYMTMEHYGRAFDKKMKLLSYFNRYMKEHLMNAGGNVNRDKDQMSRIPYLQHWCRSTSGVLMQLNNGTIQVNFTDHTKIIMCPLMAAISYIDEDKAFNTYRFSTIEKNGCSKGLYEKIKYAYDKIAVLVDAEEVKQD